MHRGNSPENSTIDAAMPSIARLMSFSRDRIEGFIKDFHRGSDDPVLEIGMESVSGREIDRAENFSKIFPQLHIGNEAEPFIIDIGKQIDI